MSKVTNKRVFEQDHDTNPQRRILWQSTKANDFQVPWECKQSRFIGKRNSPSWSRETEKQKYICKNEILTWSACCYLKGRFDHSDIHHVMLRKQELDGLRECKMTLVKAGHQSTNFPTEVQNRSSLLATMTKLHQDLVDPRKKQQLYWCKTTDLISGISKIDTSHYRKSRGPNLGCSFKGQNELGDKNEYNVNP